MKGSSQRAWPPLIIVSDKPRWVWWRDFALTLVMWALFATMLETEFELFFGHYLEKLGLGDFNTEANWGIFFRRLAPYFWLIVMLLALLGASTVATLHRIRRFLSAAAPPALQADEEAAHGRIATAPLLAARELRNVVVYVEADGTRRVEPRQTR